MRFGSAVLWSLLMSSTVLAQNVSVPPGSPISKLPQASLPLVGTEQVPLVQGGVTKQAPVSSVGITSSTPFIATGGSTSASAQNRATYKGVRFDVRSDFGLACDGVTNDTSPFQVMRAQVNLASTPVTLVFPAACLINAGNYVFSNSVSLEGINGGGVSLPSGQTLAADLFHWTAASGTQSIKNFTLNLNGALTTGVQNAMHFEPGQGLSFLNSSILNGGPPTSGNGLIEIGGYGLTSCEIASSKFSLTAASSYQNQSINFGSIGYPVNHCSVHDNVSVNTGFGIFVADNADISDNEVYGWGFGGGITLGPSDTSFHNITVHRNRIHDSVTSPDINSTYVAGIEGWFYGEDISDNVIRNTCGPGVAVGGLSHIHGNTVVDPGTCTGGGLINSAGFVANTNGTETASGSSIDGGNLAYNDASGVMTYGYSDQQAIIGVQFGVNNLQGSLGSYNVNGGADFNAAQKDNRIVNPCGAIDQRNEGNFSSGSFVADQWFNPSSTGHVSIQSKVAMNVGGCGTGIVAEVSTSSTPANTDYLLLEQNLPYSSLQDLAWGTSYARDGILAFCTVLSSAPPFTGSWAVLNGNAGYSYVGSYTITAAANSPQCFSFKIPANTHPLGGLTSTLTVAFDYGSGLNNKTSTPLTWVSGLFYGLSSASNFVSLPNSTTLAITAVRLLPASADEGWAPRLFAEDMALSQVYFRKSFPQGTKPAQNAGLAGAKCGVASAAGARPFIFVTTDPPMFSAPVVTTFNPSAANANWRDTTAGADVAVSVPGSGAGASSTGGVLIGASAGATLQNDSSCIHYTLDSGL